MLHLAIICIVCAVSAPSEGIPLIGLKKKANDTSCHFDEGRKALAGPYDVDVNCSATATNLFSRFLIKQYQSASNSCQVKGGRTKFMKRNLLWSLSEDLGGRNPPVTTASCSLSNCERKKFIRLVKVKHKRIKKRDLDKVKVDDDLDMNKRIKKLVQKVARENRSPAGRTSLVTPRESGFPKPFRPSFPLFHDINRIFRFSRRYKKNNPVVVNFVRVKDALGDLPNPISSLNILKALRRTTRFTRNYERETLPRVRRFRKRRKKNRRKSFYNNLPEHTLEKPFLERSSLEPYREDGLNLWKYLEFRHTLRGLLAQGIRRKRLVGKRKRCGRKCEPMPHKCWRSAPLLCIPYIRKGQDELLKFLIRSMQKLLGKPLPPKVDIFERTKYKPCCRKPPDNFEDIMPEEEECDTPSPCTEADPCQPVTQPCVTTPNPCFTCPPTTCPSPTTCPPPPCPTTQCPKPTTSVICPPTIPNICIPTTPCPTTPKTCPPVTCSNTVYPMNCKECECQVALCSAKQCSSTPFYFPDIELMRTESPNKDKATKSYSTGYSTAFTNVPNYRTPEFLAQAPVRGVVSTVQHNPASTESTRSFTYTTLSSVTSVSMSTARACSWYISQSPVDQLEFFSFTAFPCNDVGDCSQLSQEVSQIPVNEEKLGRQLANEPTAAYQGFSVESTTASLYPSSTQPLPSTTSASPSSFHPESRVSDHKKHKSPQVLRSNFPPFYQEYMPRPMLQKEKFSEVRQNRNHFRNAHDQQIRLRQEMKEERRNKHWRRFHKGLTKPGTVFFPYGNYDYKTVAKIKKNKYMSPWVAGTELKKKYKPSKRQKRGDNYYGYPDDADNYDEYFYDSSEDYPDNHPLNFTSEEEYIGPKISDVQVSESEPTPPPPQEMFNELAKDATQDDATKNASDTTTPSANQPVSTPSTPPTDSPQEGTSLEPINQLNDTKRPSDMCSELKEKEAENGNPEVDERQTPTTVKTACIVKAQKKLLTKPSPKVYTKVYPDSIPNECANREVNTTTTTLKTTPEKTTPMQTTPKPDIRLQLLAVCEGYLEVVKLIKAQNQSLEEELDADLSRYCENIISQSFNFPSDSCKSKKAELPQCTTFKSECTSPKPESSQGTTPTPETNIKAPGNVRAASFSRGGKMVVDIPKNPARNSELQGKISNKSPRGFTGREETGYLKREEQKSYKSGGKRKRKPKYGNKSQKRYQRKEDPQDELLKKRMSDEQVQLLHLLRKRKRALLSWLSNSKGDQIKPDEGLQETEYFDDEECVPPQALPSESSGTITPKGNQETTESTAKREDEVLFVNDSVFPVYAKRYGYDRGGELRQVEVLWRRLNEKTHERQVYKNLSVLALLLTSTTSPPRMKQSKTQFVANSGYNNEDMSGIQAKSENKVGFVECPVSSGGKTDSTTPTTASTAHGDKNNTYTFMSKPDPSSIVGTPPNTTTSFPNTTRKVSHKLGIAKDLFQEYTLEFLNYAVYILPVMFTFLFLVCCLCCFLQILNNNKRNRRRKKKKKKDLSTDEDTETTDDSVDLKKKRRDGKRKKQFKKDVDVESLSKKRSKTIWNVLKLNSAKPSSEFNEDNSQTEKKKSFLRFLNRRKEEGKGEELSPLHYAPLCEMDEHTKELKKDSDDQSRLSCEVIKHTQHAEEKQNNSDQIDEAKERRELIALLEEIKKIEMENTMEKVEKKSVCVQYMMQDEKNAFGPPEQPSETATIEMYQDVGELTELIPCDCHDFRINRQGRSERVFKIFRDSGGCQRTQFRETDFVKTERREDKAKSGQFPSPLEISYTGDVFDDVSPPFRLPSDKKDDLLRDMENLKRQLNKKKYVRLKDNGVLCRL